VWDGGLAGDKFKMSQDILSDKTFLSALKCCFSGQNA
jgi:hypothetical protein